MKPTISIFGGFQNGKSTLINCLLRQNIAVVGGQGLSTTKCNTRYSYAEKTVYSVRKSNGQEFDIDDDFDILSLDCHDEIVVKSPNPLLIPNDIVDTPGFNANERESLAAEYMLNHSDFAILLLHNKGMSSIEKEIAVNLTKHRIPFVVIINCYNDLFENWAPLSEGNQTIYKTIKSELQSLKTKPFSVCGEPEIFVVNLIWYWLSIPHNNLLSNNKSIIRCSKLLREFWSDFSNDKLTNDLVEELSGFEAFLSFFMSVGFLSFIRIIGVLNEAVLYYDEAFSNHLNFLRDFPKRHINENIESLEVTHRGYTKMLMKEIQDYKNKLKTISKASLNGGFLGYIVSDLVNGFKERRYIGAIAEREEKIENSKRQTAIMIALYKKLK